jgi:putative Mg2+ transporter-C (MgtC) family protein
VFDFYKEVLIKLFLSVVLGGLIGLERESLNRPAGFRTHILVCVGSTLTMLVSITIYKQYQFNADPGRIAAQVVSGIGFLGAGTIIKEGPTVRGLTTAASLWTVASIGLAIGSGYYFGAIVATLFVLITLLSLTRIENIVIRKRHYNLVNLIIEDRPGQLGKIGSKLGEKNINIKNIKMFHLEGNKISVELLLRIPADCKVDEILNELLAIDGIYDVDVET